MRSREYSVQVRAFLSSVASRMFCKRVVVIIGGSAGARIATEIFRSQNFEPVLLETYAKGDSWGSTPAPFTLQGSVEDHAVFMRKTEVDYFIATGDNRTRRSLYQKVARIVGKPAVNCVHPNAIISPSAIIGHGNLILANAIIHTNATVRSGTIVNSAVIVEHDCDIKDFAQLAPNVALGGRVIVNELAFIGLGAAILPSVEVGVNSLVAAGATVIRNVEANVIVAGCPAKFKRANVTT